MCAYSRLNGTFCSQNKRLLTAILRDEWGFGGVVVTDWGACDDRVAGLAAGQDLEMPASGPANDRAIVAAVRAGVLDEKILDRAVERNLRLYFRVKEGRGASRAFDPAAHHALARRAAAEASVLLKNDGGLLPLAKAGKVAFLGAFAQTPRYQGGGSSRINPTRLDRAWDEAVRSLSGSVELSYAVGYDLADSRPVPALLAEARAAASAADVAVVFAGLTDDFESEGFDRAHLRLPESHVALIREAAAAAKKTVVVLSNGSPVEMTWLREVDAVVEGYLGGQAGGSAAVDVLFGDAEPSGRLAETFPLRLEDNPSFLNFPGGRESVEYREGVFVGYRHYDSANLPVLFPFGHGLSYTAFEYSGAFVDKEHFSDQETATVGVTVRNVGQRTGKEVVQLYVGAEAPSIPRPRKELKGFEKIALAPGESKTVAFVLDARAFAYWDAAAARWRAEGGAYILSLGSSSTDTRAELRVELAESFPPRITYDRNTIAADLLAHPSFERAGAPLLAALRVAFGASDDGSVQSRMMDAMIRELPLRNIVAFASSVLPPGALEVILEVAAGKRPAADAEALFGVD
jgi:beta-glucosidase